VCLDFRRTAGLDLLGLLGLLAEHAEALEAVLPLLVHGLELRATIGADVARPAAERATAAERAEIDRAAEAIAAAPLAERALPDRRFWQLLLDCAGNLAYQLAFNSLIRAADSVAQIHDEYRRTFELVSSAAHRRHHSSPSDLVRVLLSGFEAVIFLVQITAVSALVVLAADTFLGGHFAALWLTATGCSFLGLLRYEWSHFLIHTPYVPKSRWYRAIWRNHRLHHYKHEGYWLGVSSSLGDCILGTNPEPRAVERSPTARTLAGS
jgi:hypothetical protein